MVSASNLLGNDRWIFESSRPGPFERWQRWKTNSTFFFFFFSPGISRNRFRWIPGIIMKLLMADVPIIFCSFLDLTFQVNFRMCICLTQSHHGCVWRKFEPHWNLRTRTGGYQSPVLRCIHVGGVQNGDNDCYNGLVWNAGWWMEDAWMDSFIRSFVRSFLPSFLPSFLHPFIHSFIHG